MEQEYISEILNIREWVPLIDLWKQIPESVEISCMDVCEEFIALGSKNTSKCFWFDRKNEYLQTFQLEDSSTYCTVIRIASSVDFMIAVGTDNGQVNIFLVPKAFPLEFQNVCPKRTKKRFIVRDLHKSSVKCVAWSRNAMQLFSGDTLGSVVLTTLEYGSNLIRSQEILNESYEIVQISVHRGDLLVCSTSRTILWRNQSDNSKATIIQIRSMEKDYLEKLGCAFLQNKTEIICSLPGLKFSLADSLGNVKSTLLFNAAFQSKPCWDIPLLNPSRLNSNTFTSLGVLHVLLDKYLVVWNQNSLHILCLDKLQIEASAKGFRNIVDVSVAGNEIFVLENSRSLVRLSSVPDSFPRLPSNIILDNLIPEEIGVESKGSVANAEEAVEYKSLIPIDFSPDNTAQRLEAFNQIGNSDFETNISHSIKRGKHKRKQVKSNILGIVEIGHTAKENATNSSIAEELEGERKSEGIRTFEECVDASQISNNLPDKENVTVQTIPRQEFHFVNENYSSVEGNSDISHTVRPSFDLPHLKDQRKLQESNASSEWEFLNN